MCHNSVIENEQIEKCIENGMPTKIIQTIKNTMRKRAANEQISNKLQQQQQTTSYQNSDNNNNGTQEIHSEMSQAFVSKCPFGHGKFTTSASKIFESPPATPPTAANTSLMDNELDFSNNNNNLYERFPQISQLNRTTKTAIADNSNATDKIYYNDDILAKITQLTREFTYTMQQAIRRLQSNKIYTLLTKTTQPAHIVAIAIVIFVLITVWPELNDAQHSANQQQYTSSLPKGEMSVKKIHILAFIAYVGAFSAHFGAQIWMTFVSGLSLYLSLPRHIFGQCQQVLFPKYFAMNAALSITMLILYMKYFINTWTLAKCIQLGSLSLSGAIELFVRLYLAPPLLRLMLEKYKIEGTIGSGKEIGSLVQGDLTKCPHYQRIHKTFRRIHMTVAIGNIITMAGSCLQLYNIAGQLQISLVD